MIRKIAKALQLKKLTALINFRSNVRLNNKNFKIPIVNNMGLMNLSVKNDWLMALFNTLKLPVNGSFIDVGVNVGQTLLMFRSSFDNPYWGFEPNPACVFYVKLLSQANGFRNVNIIPVGLSSTTEIGKFYTKHMVDSAGTTVNALRPDFYDVADVNFVPLFSLDNLHIDGLENISMIKIDVEGGELEVLEGMEKTIQKYQPYIVCEILDYHTSLNSDVMQARADKLYAYMQQLQYDVFRVNHAGNGIALEKQDAIRLRKWVPESADLNDYLLLPKSRSKEIVAGMHPTA